MSLARNLRRLQHKYERNAPARGGQLGPLQLTVFNGLKGRPAIPQRKIGSPMTAKAKNEAAFATFMNQHGDGLRHWYAGVVATYGSPPYTRDAAVAHEAGHALVTLTLGGEIRSVEVYQAQPGMWVGWSEVSWPGIESRPVNALEHPIEALHSLLFRLAGFAGESAAGLEHMASSPDETYHALSVLIGVALRRGLNAERLMDTVVNLARHRIEANAALFNEMRQAMADVDSLLPSTLQALVEKHGVVKPPLKALW